MTITREHLAGLELVKQQVSITNPFAAEQLEYLITQAQAAPVAEPVAWMLADAVGGGMLEFQHDLLLAEQCRYGGRIVPLYTAPPHDANLPRTKS